jgi:hypothetical protein
MMLSQMPALRPAARATASFEQRALLDRKRHMMDVTLNFR